MQLLWWKVRLKLWPALLQEMFGNVAQTFDPIVCTTHLIPGRRKLQQVDLYLLHPKRDHLHWRSGQWKLGSLLLLTNITAPWSLARKKKEHYLKAQVNTIVVMKSLFTVVTSIVTGNVWKCCSNFWSHCMYLLHRWRFWRLVGIFADVVVYWLHTQSLRGWIQVDYPSPSFIFPARFWHRQWTNLREVRLFLISLKFLVELFGIELQKE